MTKDKKNTRANNVTAVLLSPQLSSALALEGILSEVRFTDDGNYQVEVADIFCELTEQIVEISKSNDMQRAQEILISQATTLDVLFGHFLQKGLRSNSKEHMETFMNMALKTQRQSRATLETLGKIKNPQPYIRQQNMAYNQQINNSNISHAREENKKMSNELLEDQVYEQEWMVARTQKATSGNDKELEAVGKKHRP